jgi:hypothetical protein
MYSSIDYEANDLVDQFRHEAIVRYAAESKSDSMLNIAAAIFLSLGCIGRGKDGVVTDYLSEATSMGARMGLFGVGPDFANAKLSQMGYDEVQAACYTAWGVFNSITYVNTPQPNHYLLR